MKLTFKGSQGINGWGWFGYVEDGLLFIGWNDPHEGGILYQGYYEGEKTPYLNEIKKDNIKLYNSIVKYFGDSVVSDYKDIVMSNSSMTDMEKLCAVFSADKEELRKHFPQLYYAILAVLDSQKKPDATSYFNKE
jgi:hypothetical protein